MPLGTRRLREDLQRERGVSVEEAEQLIRGGERSDLLDPFVATRGDELATGIERAAAFLQSSSRSGAQISKLYLVGGGARVPGLAKVLADRLRVPVELANPLGRLNVADGVFDELNMDEVAPLLMLPIGLALRTAA
jgi:type IV pilus assembly protein PilM